MEEEKKRNRKSAFITGGIQLGLLVVVYFLIAWKEPFPPIPEYGIELNFGFQQAGSLTKQPTEEIVEEEQPTEPIQEEIQQEETPIENQQSEEVVTEPVEEVVEDINSPVVTEEIVDPTKETKEETPEEVVEVVEEEPKKKKEETPKKEVKPATSKSEEEGKSSTEGKKDDKGDEGKPEGKINERALYSKKGSEEGASLNLTGWEWDQLPKPDDDSEESGKIVYKITIDDEGEIISMSIVTSNVSPTVEKKYAEAVQRLTFSKNTDYKPAPSSTGTITFILKTK